MLHSAKSLEGLFLTGSFQWDAIKANIETTIEHERLNNETLQNVPQTKSTTSPRTLTFTLINTRSLRKHAIDITSDSRLTENDTVTNIHHLLNDFSIVFNNRNFGFSSLAIAYRNSAQIYSHKGSDGISEIY